MTIPANYETHPRQLLREAGRLFAPLGWKGEPPNLRSTQTARRFGFEEALARAGLKATSQ